MRQRSAIIKELWLRRMISGPKCGPCYFLDETDCKLYIRYIDAAVIDPRLYVLLAGIGAGLASGWIFGLMTRRKAIEPGPGVGISRFTKTIVGIGTAWVALYGLASILSSGFIALMGSIHPGALNLRAVQFYLEILIYTGWITGVVRTGLLVFYLVHAIRNQRGSEWVRVLLGVSFLVVPSIGMPVYFYLYIWRSEPPGWALAADGSDQ